MNCEHYVHLSHPWCGEVDMCAKRHEQSTTEFAVGCAYLCGLRHLLSNPKQCLHFALFLILKCIPTRRHNHNILLTLIKYTTNLFVSLYFVPFG